MSQADIGPASPYSPLEIRDDLLERSAFAPTSRHPCAPRCHPNISLVYALARGQCTRLLSCVLVYAPVYSSKLLCTRLLSCVR